MREAGHLADRVPGTELVPLAHRERLQVPEDMPPGRALEEHYVGTVPTPTPPADRARRVRVSREPHYAILRRHHGRSLRRGEIDARV